MPEHKLWCYIEGQYEYFSVPISLDDDDDDVYDLKERIFAKGSSKVFGGCSAMELTLIKVYVDLLVVRGETSNKGQYKRDANDLRRLWPEEKISAVWPEPPPDTHLHIFVELPTGSEMIAVVLCATPTQVTAAPLQIRRLTLNWAAKASLQDRKIQERSATYTATSLLLSDESDVLEPSFVDNLTRVQGHSAASKTVQLVSTECVVVNDGADPVSVLELVAKHDTEFSLLLREIDIVIVREDLIKEIGARINMQHTLSCTNDINMRIGDVSFTIHAHVVHTAPFRLLLGRPFQYLLLCQHEDYPDCVEVLCPAEGICRVRREGTERAHQLVSTLIHVMSSSSLGSTAFIIFAVLSVVTLKELNVQVSEPYMDEPFHVPQVQAYCNGDWTYWDPKVTAPPGLWRLYLRFFSSRWQPHACYATTNGYARRLLCFPPTLDAVVLSTFPIAWFFGFLYYTDVPSLLSGRHWTASMPANAPALSTCTTGGSKPARLHDPPALAAGFLDLVRSVLSAPAILPQILPPFIPYALTLILFGGFVIWNGGIVLAHAVHRSTLPSTPGSTSGIRVCPSLKHTWSWLAWMHLNDCMVEKSARG
ncbi:hypothetical protein BGY98DRAFT_934606 [Russula aff. rugulosa BPL654]|nr:hypothetical protein BGY98DRAFT_934606 [Russula aff. rugulosa BPL654]